MNHDDYRKGWEAGFAAGYQHAHAEKGQQPLDDYMHELLAEERADADDKLRAKKAHAGFLLHGPAPVYQGKLTLCASCGKPAGDSPVQKQEYDHIFLYCSTNCRDYHAIGA